MPVVASSGPRCSALAATSSVNCSFSFTTLSRPSCSHSRWLLSLDAVIWSDATKIGLQYWPNARYPAPSLQRSMRRGYRASPLYLVTLGPHEASGTIVTRVSIFQQSAGLLSEAICVAPWLIHARVCLLLIATAVIDPVVLKSARHVRVAFWPR